MKKFFKNPNVQAAILLLIAIAEIVIATIYRPMITRLIAGFVLLSLISVTLVRFAYPIAKWHNHVHSVLHRKNYTDDDDEPSTFSVVMLKVAGFIFLIMQTIMLLFVCVVI